MKYDFVMKTNKQIRQRAGGERKRTEINKQRQHTPKKPTTTATAHGKQNKITK